VKLPIPTTNSTTCPTFPFPMKRMEHMDGNYMKHIIHKERLDPEVFVTTCTMKKELRNQPIPDLGKPQKWALQPFIVSSTLTQSPSLSIHHSPYYTHHRCTAASMGYSTAFPRLFSLRRASRSRSKVCVKERREDGCVPGSRR
jgi:hypothetical protein